MNTTILLIYTALLIPIALINFATVYHFLRFRYQGDLSLFFIIFFTLVIIILIVLPFILFESLPLRNNVRVFI